MGIIISKKIKLSPMKHPRASQTFSQKLQLNRSNQNYKKCIIIQNILMLDCVPPAIAGVAYCQQCQKRVSGKLVRRIFPNCRRVVLWLFSKIVSRRDGWTVLRTNQLKYVTIYIIIDYPVCLSVCLSEAGFLRVILNRFGWNFGTMVG